MHICVWLVCMRAGIHRDQKRSPEPLELELQVAMSCPLWMLRTELKSSERTVSALKH